MPPGSRCAQEERSASLRNRRLIMTIRILTRCASTFCIVCLYGCAAPPDSGEIERTTSPPTSSTVILPPRDESQPSEPASTLIDARPAAIVNGRTVNWGHLRPILTDAAGAEALQELILDRALGAMIRDAGLTISEDDLVRERSLMLETLNADGNVAIRLLDELRNRQGLGTYRFNALLRRNAAMRKLVAPRVTVTEEAVQQLHDVIHGPRRQARLITVPSLPQARSAIERIEAGEAFIDVAIDLSTDSSAARGGLLEPIAAADPSYPEALRTALWDLAAGEISRPILLGDQYAVLQLEDELPGEDVPLDNVRPELERRVRLNQERQRMDQLARTILADTNMTIFDEALRESWNRSRGRMDDDR